MPYRFFVNQIFSVFVELLSSNLCSLLGNEERFAFSCIWEMTKQAEIISTRFCKSIIRSRRAMTYEEAQIKIDDLTQHDSLAKSLRGLNSLAKILKKRRIDNGCVRTTQYTSSWTWHWFPFWTVLVAHCERLVNVFLFNSMPPVLNACSDVQNTGI